MSLPVQETAEKPRLLFFFSTTDGQARRVDGQLAQVLQRRSNHETFVVHRIEVAARPDLVKRFAVAATPTIVVVDGRRVRSRLERPRNSVEIQSLLSPWLR